MRAHLYLFRTGVRRYVDGAIGGSGVEYINHSCEPNMVARVRKGRVMLVSLRRVEEGEELLLDYSVVGMCRRFPAGAARQDVVGI